MCIMNIAKHVICLFSMTLLLFLFSLAFWVEFSSCSYCRDCCCFCVLKTFDLLCFHPPLSVLYYGVIFLTMEQKFTLGANKGLDHDCHTLKVFVCVRLYVCVSFVYVCLCSGSPILSTMIVKIYLDFCYCNRCFACLKPPGPLLCD